MVLQNRGVFRIGDEAAFAQHPRAAGLFQDGEARARLHGVGPSGQQPGKRFRDAYGKPKRARALTIGNPAVEAIEEVVTPAAEETKEEEKEESEDKIITTEDGEEINLTALECEFGSYDFEGKTYYAARQMELTNRLFDGCYNDAEEGEEYISEYSAPGYDENGNPVEIFMTFTQVKGEEIDPENLNWFQDSDRVEAL